MYIFPRKEFDETKFMSFLINNDEALEKYSGENLGKNQS